MPPIALPAPAMPAAPVRLPRISFGPFRLLEAVPWLMLAATMRVVAYAHPKLALLPLALAQLSIFLAFLIAARRMIEFADGRTELARFDFRGQLRLGRAVLARIAIVVAACVTAVSFAGYPRLAGHLFWAFDGVAFDQATRDGMLFSSALAALTLLMVVQAGAGRPVTLGDALRELVARAACLVPAILVLAAVQFALSEVQGSARDVVRVYYRTSAQPEQLKALVFLVYVFSFAALRLWIGLAILTFGLRASYRRERPAASVDAPPG